MSREQDDLQAAEGDLLDQRREPWEETPDPERPAAAPAGEETETDGSEADRIDADTADVVEQTIEVPQDDDRVER